MTFGGGRLSADCWTARVLLDVSVLACVGPEASWDVGVIIIESVKGKGVMGMCRYSNIMLG